MNYRYAPLAQMLDRYRPTGLHDGYNLVDGEEIFYVSNPALGLWAHANRMAAQA